jgi:hypothetical protein
MMNEVIKAYLIYLTPIVIALLPLFFLLALNLSDGLIRKIETRFPLFGAHVVEMMLLIMIVLQAGLLLSPLLFHGKFITAEKTVARSLGCNPDLWIFGRCLLFLLVLFSIPVSRRRRKRAQERERKWITERLPLE